MLIEDYFAHLEQLLASYPYIEQIALNKEKRAHDIGFVKGEIGFVGGMRLFIMEFVRTEPHVVKTKYRYHCQDRRGTALFRYDNAPHHQTTSFPHHKHLFRPSAEEIVVASHLPSLKAILDEVTGRVEKG